MLISAEAAGEILNRSLLGVKGFHLHMLTEAIIGIQYMHCNCNENDNNN